jgi:hypothetical protein
MKKAFLINTTALSLFICSLGFAQEPTEVKQGYKYNNNFDLTLATNGNQSLGALSWVHFHSVTKNKKMKIGYGLRFNSQLGKDLYYLTAPANLTSDINNIDSLFFSQSQSNFLNLNINIQYTIKEKFDIGFNIDAVGFSFGGNKSGKYLGYQSTENGSMQMATPTSINLLLVGDNDIGALNSELYFRYWINEKWAIKTGASFVFTEYTTENKLRLDNNRFRNKSLMGMIGVTYMPFK